MHRERISAFIGVFARIGAGPRVEMDHGLLGAIPENVTVVSWVPQREIFPRAAALLCHGGAGTLLDALTHGLPMVVTPLGADQPDNARLVEATGAGIALLDPDASSLRKAVERALHDTNMRAASVKIAREIATLPSMTEAIQHLERLVAK